MDKALTPCAIHMSRYSPCLIVTCPPPSPHPFFLTTPPLWLSLSIHPTQLRPVWARCLVPPFVPFLPSSSRSPSFLYLPSTTSLTNLEAEAALENSVKRQCGILLATIIIVLRFVQNPCPLNATAPTTTAALGHARDTLQCRRHTMIPEILLVGDLCKRGTSSKALRSCVHTRLAHGRLQFRACLSGHFLGRRSGGRDNGGSRCGCSRDQLVATVG